MIKQTILGLNALLFLAAVLLFCLGVFYWLQRPGNFSASDPSDKKKNLPKSCFECDPSAYQKIQGPFLKLEETVPTLQVPDLRQQLVYYGRNGRPDADQSLTPMNFALASNNRALSAVLPEKPLYLLYERKSPLPHYIFSPNNEPTSLWITADPVHQEAAIHVFMKNEQGEIISEPESLASFKLPEKEFNRTGASAWDINGQRVDGTLLARQRARWQGVDQFLLDHGGKEFQEERGKQRIDFGDGDDVYSVFVGLNDLLVWEDGKWKAVKPGPESQGRPLIIVKKIDDRLMSLEIWDPEGKSKVPINLLKVVEPWGAQNVQAFQAVLKFIGARTRKQSVFEINRERMVLNPSDWLLLTSKGWKKLNTEQEIDDYVKRKLTGTLFVFEGIERRDDGQFMKGTLYSPSRADATPIDFSLQQAVKPKPPAKEKKQNPKEAKKAEAEDSPRDVMQVLEELLAPPAKGEIKGNTVMNQIRQLKAEKANGSSGKK